MGKAVMLSIHPKWVGKIVDGEKTIEIRKTKPKIEIPFKCYLYMTAGGYKWQKDPWSTAISPDGTLAKLYNGAQRVIASFDVDKIYTIKDLGSQFVVDGADEAETNGIAKSSCLDFDDMKKYAGCRKVLYAWHISDLKIYNEPKEITDFKRENRTEENVPCAHTKWLFEPCETCKACNLKRPPESWCYVEEQ